MKIRTFELYQDGTMVDLKELEGRQQADEKESKQSKVEKKTYSSKSIEDTKLTEEFLKEVSSSGALQKQVLKPDEATQLSCRKMHRVSLIINVVPN